jgi:mono/diheme cytochrome c family protein
VSRNRGTILFTLVALALVLALLAACGSDDEDPTATTSAPAATATTSGQQTPGAGDDDVEAGRQLAAAQCFACHTIDGSTSVGPTWQGLYGSEVELESGETVVADDAYIEESILDPNAKVSAGFPASVMPNTFADVLSDEQVQQLVAYIRSLQ